MENCFSRFIAFFLGLILLPVSVLLFVLGSVLWVLTLVCPAPCSCLAWLMKYIVGIWGPLSCYLLTYAIMGKAEKPKALQEYEAELKEREDELQKKEEAQKEEEKVEV